MLMSIRLVARTVLSYTIICDDFVLAYFSYMHMVNICCMNRYKIIHFKTVWLHLPERSNP